MVNTLTSFSEEPEGGHCCEYTQVNYELTDSCCVLVTVSNSLCLLGPFNVLVQKYDNQTNEFVTEYVETNSYNFSTKICPNIGESSLIIRVRIARGYDHEIPACISDNWIEGNTQYTDTVSLDNCCDCPQGFLDWVEVSVSKNRDCPDNGCKVNLLRFDIPTEYSCYINYQLRNSQGNPISPISSIANDPLYNYSYCIAESEISNLKIYLFKQGETDLDSACLLNKWFMCSSETPSIDTTENVCTPDCFNDGWETQRWAWVEVPEGSGCQVKVLYTYRTACSPTNYQDLQVTQINTFGCPENLTNKQIYQQAVIGLIKLNPMGFKPELNTVGCDTTWRVIKTDCWRNLYEFVPPDYTINNYNGYINVVYQQCDTGQCCVQRYTVCRDSAGNVTFIPSDVSIIPQDDCEFIEEMPMPFLGPFGEVIGPLYPDICYSTCDWVTFTYNPPIYPGKIGIENIEFEFLIDNKLKVDCNINSTCNIRIEYYNLQGILINIVNKTISGTDNDIDITSYINQKGILIYRIYINDNLYKTGKFVK